MKKPAKISAAKRRRLIARIMRPDAKRRGCRHDDRAFDKSYPEGATLAQVAKRIANLLDMGADPNRQVTITAGNVCHDICSTSTGFLSCNFTIQKDVVLDNSWRVIGVLKSIVKNHRKIRKAEIVEACLELLKMSGQTP